LQQRSASVFQPVVTPHGLSAETTTEPVTALALLRQAGIEPDATQVKVCQSQAQYQLWLMHRQWGKSTMAGDIALEAACNTDGALILLVSRTLRQSGELFRKVKRFYNATKPLPLLRSSALSLELSNGSRIVSLPGSADTVVGYSAPTLIVIDEAARVADALYYALRPMLAMSGGRLIALSTPWGKRGWFFNAWSGAEEAKEQEQLTPEQARELLLTIGMDVEPDRLVAEAATAPFGWERTQVTCRDNARINPYFLANELRTVPRLVFQSEWLTEFVDTEDSVFRYDDLQAMLDDRIAPLWGEQAPALAWTSEGLLPLFEEVAA
jgi:hypothetical protein